jgi:hypothetical protein
MKSSYGDSRARGLILKNQKTGYRLTPLACIPVTYTVFILQKLIKEGMLLKFSRKEPQPRMFFLFNDILIYASSIPPTNTTYKVHTHCQFIATCTVEEKG